MQYHSWQDFENDTNKQINRIGTLKSESYVFLKISTSKKEGKCGSGSLCLTLSMRSFQDLPGAQGPICPMSLDP